MNPLLEKVDDGTGAKRIEIKSEVAHKNTDTSFGDVPTLILKVLLCA